ncbi:interferon-induced protein 44-like [Clarias gariepinus]
MEVVLYKTHYMMRKDGSCLPFVFSDTMGLEPKDRCGAHVEDIILAIKGFLIEDYKFNPLKPVSVEDQYYRKKPKVEHQTFCLVNILAADKLLLMDQSVIKKMKIIHEEATQLDIPQVIILTKVDEACRLVRKDIKMVYTSKKIKDQMQECSNWLGIPLSHIFPVKNYSEEINTDANMDILILKALEHIMNIASDALKSQTLIIPGQPPPCPLL